jgi:hypothetical protein
MQTGSEGRIWYASCRSKIVPRVLSADQKLQHTNVSIELRQLASCYETFLCRVITGDKSWVDGYDPETKQQSFK